MRDILLYLDGSTSGTGVSQTGELGHEEEYEGILKRFQYHTVVLASARLALPGVGFR